MSIKLQLEAARDALNFAVDLEIPGQGVTALFGRSGAGKTTLLRVIAGLEHFDQARVVFGNTVWQDQDNFVPPHRRRLAYVFQEPRLFAHLNVRDNIAYGKKRQSDSEHISPMLERQIIELLGISELLERNINTLSGGEQQRVAIARALASNPQLLLMDEPLTAVDHERRHEILPLIEQLHEALNLPIVYVSHSTHEVARIADTLVLIEAGRNVAQGPIEQVLTRTDLALAQRDDAEALLIATPLAYSEQHQINRLALGSEELLLSGAALPLNEALRVRIAARDVSITLERQTETSILNILPARIKDLRPLTNAQALVSLDVGGQCLLARLTQHSVQRLNLAIGQNVFAQVKSVAVIK